MKPLDDLFCSKKSSPAVPVIEQFLCHDRGYWHYEALVLLVVPCCLVIVGAVIVAELKKALHVGASFVFKTNKFVKRSRTSFFGLHTNRDKKVKKKWLWVEMLPHDFGKVFYRGEDQRRVIAGSVTLIDRSTGADN